MAVQLATLDILVDKGRFDPQVARAIGEAIESEIKGSQFVTVPLLDVRLTELRGSLKLKIEATRSQLEVKLAQLESRLFLKMVALAMTGFGALIAVLRIFRPTL